MYEPIKNILDTLLAQHQEDWHWYLVKNWTTVVGTLSARMRLEKVADNMLIVGVYDVRWMHELHMLSPVIIRTINEKLGGNFVQKIRFSLVEKKIKKDKLPTKQTSLGVAPFLPRHAVALSQVKNKDLHEALKKYFERCMQR